MIIQILTALDLRMQFMPKENDPFGFADAIQLDHLDAEQLKIVEDILKDFK